LPRRLQIEFSRVVQAAADTSGKEITAGEIYRIFSQEYLERQSPYAYRSHRMSEDTTREQPVQISVALENEGRALEQAGQGNGPIDAFVAALGLDIRVMDYHEHAIGAGASAQAASYVELRVGDGPTMFGVGVDGNIVTASFKAVVSAVNRHRGAARE